MVHPFIEPQEQDCHNVKRACELPKVSRGAFYARRTTVPGLPHGARRGSGRRSSKFTKRRAAATAPVYPCRVQARRQPVRAPPGRAVDASGRPPGPTPQTRTTHRYPQPTRCRTARPSPAGLPARPGRRRHTLVRRDHLYPDRSGVALPRHPRHVVSRAAADHLRTELWPTLCEPPAHLPSSRQDPVPFGSRRPIHQPNSLTLQPSSASGCRSAAPGNAGARALAESFLATLKPELLGKQPMSTPGGDPMREI